MFETVSSAELASLPPVYPAGPRTQVWGYVLQAVQAPWFHVELEGEGANRIVFAMETGQWLPLVESQGGDNPRVHGVNLVSPGWINGKDRWLLEPLLEVWRADEPFAKGRHAEVYVVSGGSRYVRSELDTPETRLKGIRRLYKAP